MAIHIHNYRIIDGVPNQDGTSHYYKEMSLILRHFLHAVQLRYHDITNPDSLNMIQNDDTVLCLLGPFAYVYAWHREKSGLDYAIVRDVHTAFWGGYLLQERLCLPLTRKQDRVLFPSSYAKRLFHGFFPGAYGDSALVLYPLIESLPKPRPRSHSASSGMRLGYIGSLGVDKNMPDLVKSLTQIVHAHTDTTFRFCGEPFSPSCSPERIIALLCNAGFDKKQVIYDGILKRCDLPGFFASIDVLLFPSTSSVETLGRVVLEANHYKTAVVAADHGAMPELLPQLNRVPVSYRFGERIPLCEATPLGNVDPILFAEAILNSGLQNKSFGISLQRYEYSTFAHWIIGDHIARNSAFDMEPIGFDWYPKTLEKIPLETGKLLSELFMGLYNHNKTERIKSLERMKSMVPEFEYERFRSAFWAGRDWLDFGTFARAAWHVAGVGGETVLLKEQLHE